MHLATRDDRWPLAQHPTGVELIGLLFERLVEHRVEHRDDLTLDFDAVGDQNRVAIGSNQTFGDRRLAGAWRPIQEDRAVAADRRTELVDQTRRKHEVGKRPGELLVVQREFRGLGTNDPRVEIEGNRNGSDVFAFLAADPRLGAALLGDRQHVGPTLHALVFDQATVSQRGCDRLDHAGGAVHALGHSDHRRTAFSDDDPQHDVFDER